MIDGFFSPYFFPFLFLFPSSFYSPFLSLSSISLSFLPPLSSLLIALIGDSHVMGWGSKAIEIRAVDNGQLDGVFMHKRTQKLRFLCERNDKVCYMFLPHF